MTRQLPRATPEDYAMREINHTIGNQYLCAWLVAPGVCWVQTRNPRHAARLLKRGDTRLVVRGVTGGYLRTFEVEKPLSWARKLIARYQSSETSAGRGMEEAFSARPTGKEEERVQSTPYPQRWLETAR